MALFPALRFAAAVARPPHRWLWLPVTSPIIRSPVGQFQKKAK